MIRFVLSTSLGNGLASGLGLLGNAALSQIRVNNVNAIHELYSENQLTAKSNTTINSRLLMVVWTALTATI